MSTIKKYYLGLAVFLCSCAGLSESGEYKTDEEMIAYLNDHIGEFNELVELKGECNSFYAENGNDLIVTEKCQKIFTALGIDYAHYYQSGDEERIRLRTYHLLKGIFSEYQKGYLYRYSSIAEISLSENSLDDFPNGGPCDNWFRAIKVENEDIGDGWYIYDDRFCD